MGIMLQDSFIFSGTIADNLRYGKLDATYEEMVRAAQLLHADEFIQAMRDGYDTKVRSAAAGFPRGRSSSSPLLAPLLADPKILVLDEATSSIDTATEKLLQGINLLLKGPPPSSSPTAFPPSAAAVKIMYIDRGQILESGTHDELMERRATITPSICLSTRPPGRRQGRGRTLPIPRPGIVTNSAPHYKSRPRRVCARRGGFSVMAVSVRIPAPRRDRRTLF